MKRFTSLLLIIMMLFSSVIFVNADTAAENNNIFSDVPANHWANKEIQYFYEQGIVNGYEDGSFHPSGTVTREEFCKLLVSSFEYNQEEAMEQTFADVSPSRWSYQYVEACKDFLTVYSNPFGGRPSFRPAEIATREDIAVALVTMMGYTEKDVKDKDYALKKFTDGADITPALVTYVSIACEKGLLNGYPDGTFGPGSGVTRAETVVLLDRATKQAMTDITKPEETAPSIGGGGGSSSGGGSTTPPKDSAPVLVVSEPAINNDTRIVTFTGTAKDENSAVTLTINGETVPIDASGSWSKEFELKDGENVFEFVAVNAAGRQVKHQKTITYTKPEPPYESVDIYGYLIEKVQASGRVRQVELWSKEKREWYNFVNDAAAASAADISEGEIVKFRLDKDENIENIEPALFSSITGKVNEERTLIGSTKINPNAVIFIMDMGTACAVGDFNDLEIDRYIKIEAIFNDDGEIIVIKIGDYDNYAVVTGKMVLAGRDNMLMLLDKGGNERDCVLNDSNVEAVAETLIEGDIVVYSFNKNGKIDYLEKTAIDNITGMVSKSGKLINNTPIKNSAVVFIKDNADYSVGKIADLKTDRTISVNAVISEGRIVVIVADEKYIGNSDDLYGIVTKIDGKGENADGDTVQLLDVIVDGKIMEDVFTDDLDVTTTASSIPNKAALVKIAVNADGVITKVVDNGLAAADVIDETATTVSSISNGTVKVADDTRAYELSDSVDIYVWDADDEEWQVKRPNQLKGTHAVFYETDDDKDGIDIVLAWK